MQFCLPFTVLFGVLLLTECAARAAAEPAPATPKPADSWASLFDDPVVARGKGLEVKRSQVENAFIAYKANLAMRGQTVPEELRSAREAMLLERLIINRVMVNRVTEADRVRAKEINEKFLGELKKELPSEEAFNRRLKAIGMTAEHYNKLVEEQGLADAVLERELKSKITVTDAQVREFYDTGTDVLVRSMEAVVEKMAQAPDTRLDQLTDAKKKIDEVKKVNLLRLERPEAVRVIHLLLATRDREKDEPYPEEQQKAKRQLMEKLLARARSGEDFAKLVWDYSEDRGLKETKGEYTFSRNAKLAPEFKAAAFTLQTSQISDVVVTPYGYHIIKLLEKIPAAKLEFDKAAPDIKEFLQSQELQRQMPEFFEKIKKEAGVEILDPRYKFSPGKAEDARPAQP